MAKRTPQNKDVVQPFLIGVLDRLEAVRTAHPRRPHPRRRDRPAARSPGPERRLAHGVPRCAPQDKNALAATHPAIADNKAGKEYVLSFASKVFLRADNEDRAGNATSYAVAARSCAPRASARLAVALTGVTVAPTPPAALSLSRVSRLACFAPVRPAKRRAILSLPPRSWRCSTCLAPLTKRLVCRDCRRRDRAHTRESPVVHARPAPSGPSRQATERSGRGGGAHDRWRTASSTPSGKPPILSRPSARAGGPCPGRRRATTPPSRPNSLRSAATLAQGPGLEATQAPRTAPRRRGRKRRSRTTQHRRHPHRMAKHRRQRRMAKHLRQPRMGSLRPHRRMGRRPRHRRTVRRPRHRRTVRRPRHRRMARRRPRRRTTSHRRRRRTHRTPTRRRPRTRKDFRTCHPARRLAHPGRQGRRQRQVRLRPRGTSRRSRQRPLPTAAAATAPTTRRRSRLWRSMPSLSSRHSSTRTCRRRSTILKRRWRCCEASVAEGWEDVGAAGWWLGLGAHALRVAPPPPAPARAAPCARAPPALFANHSVKIRLCTTGVPRVGPQCQRAPVATAGPARALPQDRFRH